jgi:hypothetical protein
MSSFGERVQVLLDHVASGQLGAHDFLMRVSAAGLSSGLSAATVQQGLRALGISSLTRSPELPDVPTIAQTGCLVTNTSHGSVSSPPGQLGLSCSRASTPCYARPWTNARSVARPRRRAANSDQFREKVRSEIERWGPVIGKSGIKGSL